ncbi:TfoX/Sxy family protein [Pseudorhodoferax sp.]|uniref:TfoX/Sxy family protein n=1 Tax=Pseudorhodoferax sp. TaxID=1993553 RepID=UPI0039E54AF5
MGHLVDCLPDVFAPLGRVAVKRMFGGHGIWHDGLMFALVAGGTLYLKADAASASHFDALDLPPFGYERRGRRMQTSYRQAPEILFEDRQQAALWSRRAFEAALRAANAKPARAKKARPRPPAG